MTDVGQPVALVTGGAQRIGAEICRCLHQRGYRILIHYRHSEAAAGQLCAELNTQRPQSAATIAADMTSMEDVQTLAEQALGVWQRVDVLVNNASTFYPTAVGEASEADWDALMGSNLKGPFFLSQALAPALQEQGGCIINLVDIYAKNPLPSHSVYCMAKAGVAMMTQSLALELAPAIRVNGVSPGNILWPDHASAYWEQEKKELAARVPLQREGEAGDIANTVAFLVVDAPYITGQILAVDGGRSLAI
ncbi:pteridine reductase [Zhongshania sp.]|uniref:pteridine reductase n=1 Tax=Zhongshania sp. TaxID=1971902 RepID=UPI0035628BFA